MQNAQSKTIEVVVNGHARRVPEGHNISTLLRFLEIDPSRVAVELNREIVRKPAWDSTAIHEGANIEIVWFVGGG
ncbi:MAG TPA: sulfur carrier protein ThiS [Bryobacteraceae bacterium]|nr:sulfur carrier protein ThiS [Bryobacteraceae bacterium]